MAAVVAIGGALMTIGGNIQSNQAQAAAERRNAAFYEEQGEFARKAMERQLSIYNMDSAVAIGNQQSGFARAGVTMDGSPMAVVASSIYRQVKERNAITDEGNQAIQEAYLRAGASRSNANYLTGFSYNALQTGTTILGAYASYAASSAGGGKGGGYDTSSMDTSSLGNDSYSFGQYSNPSGRTNYGFGNSYSFGGRGL